MMCRNCQKTRANRPRGLCWSCYYRPGVREQFGPISKFGRRGVGNGNGRAPLPEKPTMETPGSEAKIMVLMERAARRQSLFHPADRTLGGAAVPAEPLRLREAG